MAINAINGISVDTDSVINGISGVDEVNGLALESGGGGGAALVAQLTEVLGINGGTTSGIDTTGADLLAIELLYYDAVSGVLGAGSISDSKGNTYTAATNYSSNNHSSRLFYCASPIVGSGHTFTMSEGSTYSVLGVLAFSGSNAAPFDSENGAAASQPGSITPAANGSIVVTGAVTNATGIPSADGSFTSYAVDSAGGSNVGGGIAYWIQPTAASVNPTWSGGPVQTSNIASFLPA